MMNETPRGGKALMTSTEKRTIRALVRGAYDIQKLRIQMGNRMAGNFRAKLGQKPGETAEQMKKEAKKLLKDLLQRFRLLADAVALHSPKELMAAFVGDEVISSYTEFALIQQYVMLRGVEADHFKRLGVVIEPQPIWTQFLAGVKGIGPAMAGVLISEIDIARAAYPSSLWKYSGLDVADDGRGRSRRKEHLVQRTYTDADGAEQVRDSITFNPWLKTKLVGVLGPCLIKAKNETYDPIFRDYKHRLEHHAIYKDVSKGHRQNMAVRHMVKMFLRDLYCAWRPLEGLRVAPSYAEAKLGRVHRQAAAG